MMLSRGFTPGSRAFLMHATNPATGERAVLLTFKGTEPFFLRDWLVDGNVEMYRHRPGGAHPQWVTLGAMHRGFLFALGLVDRPKVRYRSELLALWCCCSM
jgi:hypothetical protein